MADQIVNENRWCEKPRPSRMPALIIGTILLILAGEGLFQFVLAPNMRIGKIIVENELQLSREQLLSIAGVEAEPYYFDLNVETVKKNLEAWPAVKSAYVRKIFPDSLRIIAQARKPLAVAFAESGGATLPLAFDEEGVVFQSGADVSVSGLPVVSGIRFEGIKAGMRLPAMLGSLFQDLKTLKSSSPAILGGFSEFRIVKKGEEHFEILLYPVHHRVPVRIEGSLTEERCKMILLVLDVMNRESLLEKVEELDFRTGDIIYRMKKEG
jgi:cell division protein FtsQ